MGIRGTYYTIDDDILAQLIEGHIDFENPNPPIRHTLEIDKAYYLIQYLLCGCVEGGEPPMGYVVPIRDENVLPTPFCDCDMYFLRARQVQEASAFLDTLDILTLKNRFDFAAMKEKEIYPIIEADTDADGYFEYLSGYLAEIREFLRQAFARGDAVLFYLA